MTVVFEALIPVGLIIIIGLIAGKTLSLEKQSLSQLVIYILSPALIAGSLYRTNLSSESTTNLVIGYTITTLVLFLLTWGLSKILRLPPIVQKSLIATTLFPNTGNLGLPVNDFAFGTPGLERAIIYLIIASVFTFASGPALLAGGGIISRLRLTLKIPLFWAILVGLLLRLLPIALPENIDRAVEMLGRASIPLGLLILGLQLAQTSFKVGIYEAFAAAMRLLISPAIAYAVGLMLGLADLDLQVLVLQSAMPTAVNTVVLVTEFGGDAPRVAKTVVVSTVLSFLTLPLVLWAIA
ncbi:AEC family transporter [Oscillatoria salina]|uniref:AEC family transporter n=1 Tax=Oscillatoria salina TaxID=331517 RepID=UPI0013B84842|nr:AEC family transporter [Oscillatoria salina]MBZ8179997.1 AEC family transporter [Oscillatoria salina IIICB1]NET90340.1 AEC family transporter [Kamptonema sp. SIO1D9]